MSDLPLEKQVVLVTGAGDPRGLGYAVACKMAQAGADLLLADIKSCQHAADAVREFGRQAESIPLDITDRAAVRSAFENLGDDHRARFRGLVNVAGLYRNAAVLDETDADFEAVIGVNIRGTRNVSVEAFRLLKKTGGWMIHVASLAGQDGARSASLAYSMSKAAVIALSHHMARAGFPTEQRKHAIRSNAIAPGPAATAMLDLHDQATLKKLMASIPLGRPVSPYAIAQTALYLATCEDITGQTISPNRGLRFSW